MVNDFEKKLRNELVHIWEVISETVERQEGQIINQNSGLSSQISKLSSIDGELNSIKCYADDILVNARNQTQRILENTDNVVELLQLILEQQKETNTLLKDLCDKKE